MTFHRFTYTYNRNSDDWNRAIVFTFGDSVRRSDDISRYRDSFSFRHSLGYRVNLFFGYLDSDLNATTDNFRILKSVLYSLHAKTTDITRAKIYGGNLSKCAGCRLVYNPHMHTKENRLCNHCAELLIVCPTCGEAHARESRCSNCEVKCFLCAEYYNRNLTQMVHYFNLENDLIWLCIQCASNRSLYDTCTRCHGAFYVWDMESHVSDCGKLIIREYSYKPVPIFLKAGNQRSKRYFGIECEAECLNGDNKTVARNLSDIFYSDPILSSAVYLKSDSSLNNGIEFVTHPMTRKYFTDVFFQSWEKFTRSLVSDFGLRSHDTDSCGLHVHISRDSASVSLWAKLNLFWCTQPFIDSVCRRESNHYAEKKDLEYHSVTERFLTRPVSRYEAINFTNDHTIEVRQFRGTLNATTTLATILFLDEALHFLNDDEKTISYIRNNDLTNEFLSYVTGRSGNYSLVNYMKNVIDHTYNGRHE